MPQCLRCGNRNSFTCSHLPNTTPWVNGTVSALIGNFNGKEVTYMENMGAPVEIAQEALVYPERFFDTCSVCGSSQIIWS